MTIILYSFAKRKKSTKRPTTGGVNYTGVLKDNTSVGSPTVLFEFSAFPSYNYAYIPEFSRYYWITEKTQVANNLWSLTMKCDTLASYRTEIGNANKYVIRSASRYDGDIVDTKYPTTAEVSFNRATVSPFSDNTPTGVIWGTYVLGIVTDTGLDGAVSYYAMSPSEMLSLRNYLMTGNDYFASITDQDIRNFAILLGNPMQYIKSCRFYPLVNLANTPVTPIRLGNITYPSGHVLTGDVIYDTKTSAFTHHPLSAQRGFYTDYEPFTQRFIYWEPIGLVHIPSSLFAGWTQCRFNFTLDLTTGTGRLILQTDSVPNYQGIIYETSYILGYDVPLAQMVSGDPTKLISSGTNALSAGLSALTGNISGMVAGATGAVIDFISANVPQMTNFLAGGGSRLPVGDLTILECFYGIADDDNAEFGRPYMKTVQINQLSGYVLCADGELETDGTEPEITELESYLTGGFFYE